MSSPKPCAVGAPAACGGEDGEEAQEEREKIIEEPTGEALGCLEAAKEEGGGGDVTYGFDVPSEPWWFAYLLTGAFSEGKVPSAWYVRRLGCHRALSSNVSFTESLMTNEYLWMVVFGFITIQLSFVALTGDGFFGNLTGGVVESLRLSTGTSMTWHVFTGSALWTLGFVQIYCKSLRKGPLAFVHRWSGRLHLFLWCFFVGPTSAYLSLVVGLGRVRWQAGGHFFMAMFALTGVDTTVFAYYYFWRALVVVRHRTAGEGSLDLHGRAMRFGAKFTMLIVAQRSLQFVVIALRFLIVSLLRLLRFPELWELTSASAPSMLRAAIESVVTLPFDHNVILSYTTLVPAAIMLLAIDGPYSNAGWWGMSLKESEAEAFFGRQEPSLAERWMWRLRVPFYIALRAAIAWAGLIEGGSPLEAAG